LTFIVPTTRNIGDLSASLDDPSLTPCSHLLGKKSWNVYNADNIAKVKRDEAAAKAIEEAEEQRMQELDAERRIQILRGKIPTPLAIEDAPHSDHENRDKPIYSSGRERKRRKKTGENDTDFELRVAREDQASVASNPETQLVLRKENNAPLTDHRGHISLFPTSSVHPPVEKNPEAEKEAAKKKREYEDQYTMRFSNAAGFKQGLENPWYSKHTGGEVAAENEEVVGMDVWGNEDPRRREREAKRVVDNDPLAFMKKGAAQVRQVERERKLWREEKEKEMRELEAAESRKKRKRRHEDEDNELESFRLDGSEKRSSRRHEREKEHKHRHRYSNRSSHGEEKRHRHGHRHHRHHD
jgi:N-terminal domain of CBF1 interacting co-repressor CIR